MKLQESFLNDYKALEHLFSVSSTSMKKRISYDIETLESLGAYLNYDTSFFQRDGAWSSEAFEYTFSKLPEIHALSKRVIQVYKDTEYTPYYRQCYERLSFKEKTELFSSFLNYFHPAMYSLYKEMMKEEKILVCESSHAGMAFPMHAITSGYILLSDAKGDLLNLSTLLHELMHIYIFRFLGNYSWDATKNMLVTFLSEAPSMYIEDSFWEYLRKLHVYEESVLYQQNWNLLDLLFYTKKVNYFCSVYPREDVAFYYDDMNYLFEGNTEFQEDSTSYIYRYNENMRKGIFLYFNYLVSCVAAKDLLEREKSGEEIKKSLHEFLMEYQQDSLENYYLEECDLASLRSNLLIQKKNLNKIMTKK